MFVANILSIILRFLLQIQIQRGWDCCMIQTALHPILISTIQRRQYIPSFLSWCILWESLHGILLIGGLSLCLRQYLHIYCPQDPVPPPAPHSNRLSVISLPGERSCSSSPAQPQGRGRAARPSSTYEMLSSSSGQTRAHQARRPPLVRWGPQTNTGSESKYRISMTVPRVKSQNWITVWNMINIL